MLQKKQIDLNHTKDTKLVRSTTLINITQGLNKIKFIISLYKNRNKFYYLLLYYCSLLSLSSVKA